MATHLTLRVQETRQTVVLFKVCLLWHWCVAVRFLVCIEGFFMATHPTATALVIYNLFKVCLLWHWCVAVRFLVCIEGFFMATHPTATALVIYNW
ncbi:hypothetical protein QUB70_23595 [Microcoleus sp. A003_D6]